MLVEFTPQGVTNQKKTVLRGPPGSIFCGGNFKAQTSGARKFHIPVIFKNPHIWEPKKIEGMGCLARENISSKLGFGVPCGHHFFVSDGNPQDKNCQTHVLKTGRYWTYTRHAAFVDNVPSGWCSTDWLIWVCLNMGFALRYFTENMMINDKPSNIWKTMCSPSGCHHSIVQYKKSWISSPGGPINHVTSYNISCQYQL